MFTKAYTNGLRAVLLLAARKGEYVTVRELSERMAVPRAALAKTLASLSAAGVIDTLRGPRGGCRWKLESTSLTLLQLARILDVELQDDCCVLGLENCTASDCLLPGYGQGAFTWALSRTTLGDAIQRCSQDESARPQL